MRASSRRHHLTSPGIHYLACLGRQARHPSIISCPSHHAPSRLPSHSKRCSIPTAVLSVSLSRQRAWVIVSCLSGAEKIGQRTHGRIDVCVAGAVRVSLSSAGTCRWGMLLGLMLSDAEGETLAVGGWVFVNYNARDLDRLASVRADVSCCLTLPGRLVDGVTTGAKDKLPWR